MKKVDKVSREASIKTIHFVIFKITFCLDSHNITAEKLFNPSIEYDDLLLKFREEFNKVWDTAKTSPDNGLEGFDELATLGAGSFGRVVRKIPSQKYE